MPRQGEGLGAHISQQPNILLIITDKERAVMHWPDGWAEANLARVLEDAGYYKGEIIVGRDGTRIVIPLDPRRG